jgi:hypothetical protein
VPTTPLKPTCMLCAVTIWQPSAREVVLTLCRTCQAHGRDAAPAHLFWEDRSVHGFRNAFWSNDGNENAYSWVTAPAGVRREALRGSELVRLLGENLEARRAISTAWLLGHRQAVWDLARSWGYGVGLHEVVLAGRPT